MPSLRDRLKVIHSRISGRAIAASKRESSAMNTTKLQSAPHTPTPLSARGDPPIRYGKLRMMLPQAMCVGEAIPFSMLVII